MPHSADCLCGRSQLFTFCADTPKPEFWFGDAVTFCWTDENTGTEYLERGEVCGVAWNQPENCWEYIVTWLSSTAYPASDYPIFDGNFVTAGVLWKP
ncbi:hypothetical protein QUA07_28865 [Microcoleus sp. T3_A4]|uniref:hypothetical protein n=1 Tax=Microcoleus sp. T3_A4 TaxID=2818968 RepID=UPI002FD1FA5C